MKKTDTTSEAPFTISPEDLARHRAAFSILFFRAYEEDTEEEYLALDAFRIWHLRDTRNDEEAAILAAHDAMEASRRNWDEWDKVAAHQATMERLILEEPIDADTPDAREEVLKQRRDAYPIPDEIRAIFNRWNRIEHTFMRLVLAYYDKHNVTPKSLARELFNKIPDQPEEEPSEVPRRPARPNMLPLSDQALRFASNHVTGTAITALAMLPWEKSDKAGFAYGVTQERTNFTVLYGIKDGPKAETLQQIFSRGGAPMVKAFFALWERWYQEGCKPGGFLTVDISTFCDDMGYVRHHKGGHKRENKQQAFESLNALTAIELEARYTPPGKKGKTIRLTGPLWNRGIAAEVKDEYSDLFGWEPLLFSYAPGQWFSMDEFMDYGRSVGKIGAGLRKLHNQKDEWAILIAGYFATIFRAGEYKDRNLRADTILRGAAIGGKPEDLRRASETRKRFEDSLDKLVGADILAGWHWAGTEITEPDFDDPASLAAYGTDESMVATRGNAWRRNLVTLALPEYLSQRSAPIAAGRQKAIKSAQQRTGNRKKAVSPAIA